MSLEQQTPDADEAPQFLFHRSEGLDAPEERRYVRPPQVPRLNLASLHGGDQVALNNHDWMRRNPQMVAKAHETQTLGGCSPTTQGFAWASSQDQQRIAEYYGYRDEGFVATMNGLKTDMIRPRLYIGTMADAVYLPLLKSLKITHVLNCAVEAQKAPPPYENQGLTYSLVPMMDSVDQALTLAKTRFRLLRQATAFIHTALKGGSKSNNAVFVHCVQGLSRGPAVVCAYLMEYDGLSMDKAILEVQTKHRNCLTSQHWQSCLYKFNADLLRGG